MYTVTENDFTGTIFAKPKLILLNKTIEKDAEINTFNMEITKSLSQWRTSLPHEYLTFLLFNSYPQLE